MNLLHRAQMHLEYFLFYMLQDILKAKLSQIITLNSNLTNRHIILKMVLASISYFFKQISVLTQRLNASVKGLVITSPNTGTWDQGL